MQDKIIELITRYREINKIYTTIATNGYIDFDNQRFVCDLSDIRFEADFLDKFYLETDQAKSDMILNGLKKEIDENIILYETNKELFDTLDIDAVCQMHSKKFTHRIEELLRIVNEAHKPVKEANGVLEAWGFREHTAEEEVLWEQKYQIAKREYEEAKKPLNELFQQQEQATKEAIRCNRNCFGDVYSLGKQLSSVLKNYIKRDPSENYVSHIETKKEYRISMKLSCLIHEICNGKQFEEISDNDFFANINLIPSPNKLRIKPKEKIRVCFLISCIYNHLSAEYRMTWKNDILKLLEIDEIYYKVKHNLPSSEIASDRNRDFKNEILEVFENF